jgi:hypothetical protein
MPQPVPPAVCELWLATPDAASRFDPSRLEDADRAVWSAIRTQRRRLDWASSRALLGAVAGAADRNISLSHSHGFAALALTPRPVAVGVDVEWLAPRDFKSMARIAYCAAEAEYLTSLDDPEVLRSSFYEFWTLKEAFAKALGLPLADVLGQCQLVDSSGAHRTKIPTTRQWRATVFAPRRQLRLAVVRTHEPADPVSEVIATIEWPQPRAQEWPVVLDLLSGDDHAGRTW